MKRYLLYIVAVALIMAMTPGLQAQFIWDDFSDPEASAAIWTPVDFFNANGETYEAVPGEGYVMTPTVDSPLIPTPDLQRHLGAGAFDTYLKDVSITTRVRKMQPEPAGRGGIGPLARLSPADPSAFPGDYRGYWAWINPNGELGLSSLNLAGDLVERVDVGIDVSQEDVMLRLDVIGNDISVWAWRPDAPMPVDPQIVVSDDALTAGVPGMFALADIGGTPNELSQAIFRDFHVVPAPTSFALGALAFAGLFGLRRREA